MKKNKIEVIKGYGKVKPGKIVDVDGVQYSGKTYYNIYWS